MIYIVAVKFWVHFSSPLGSARTTWQPRKQKFLFTQNIQNKVSYHAEHSAHDYFKKKHSAHVRLTLVVFRKPNSSVFSKKKKETQFIFHKKELTHLLSIIRYYIRAKTYGWLLDLLTRMAQQADGQDFLKKEKCRWSGGQVPDYCWVNGKWNWF